MPSPNKTKYLVDVKTGVLYAALMSADSKSIQSIKELGEVVPNGKARKSVYGTTAYYFELGTEDQRTVPVYTLDWPSSDEFDKGTMPNVAVKKHPGDLVRAGLAAQPVKTNDNEDEENDAELKKAMEDINKLIGLDEVKTKLKRQIALTQMGKLKKEVLGKDDVHAPSLHMVFDGNPGTGKTTVAREYGKMLKAMGLLKKGHCVEVTRKDLVAGFIGQSEEKTQKVIESAKGGVLFIDEAYSLIVDGSEKDFGKQVVDQLVAEMENNRDDLVIIVAGYTEPMKKFINANPGLKSRFQNYVHFDDFSEQELGDIIDFMSKNMDVTFAPDAKAEALKKILAEKSGNEKDFGNGRTVRNLIELAIENAAYRVMQGTSMKELRKLPKKDLKALVTQITLQDVKDVNLTGFGQSNSGKGVGFKFDQEDKTITGHKAIFDFGNSAGRSVAVNDDQQIKKPAPKTDRPAYKPK